MTDTGSSSDRQVNLAGIVLAAGKSSRFGSDKRLAAYSADDTLLTRSVSLIEPFCTRLFIATRPGEDARGRALLGRWWGMEKVEQVCAEQAARGMGSSLADTVARLRAFEQTNGQRFSGLLLMLADMPYIAPTTITKVVAAHSVDNIVIPCYQWADTKRWGHPVLFGRVWFDALQGLHGDRGGKSIIQDNAPARAEVLVDDPGILRDVDTPKDISPTHVGKAHRKAR